jgi:hypothetical protein
VSDARERIEELGLAVDDPENGSLGARAHASPGSYASIEIDDGMDRVRHDVAEGDHVLEHGEALFAALARPAGPDPVDEPCDEEGADDLRERLDRRDRGKRIRHGTETLSRTSNAFFRLPSPWYRY